MFHFVFRAPGFLPDVLTADWIEFVADGIATVLHRAVIMIIYAGLRFGPIYIMLTFCGRIGNEASGRAELWGWGGDRGCGRARKCVASGEERAVGSPDVAHPDTFKQRFRPVNIQR